MCPGELKKLAKRSQARRASKERTTSGRSRQVGGPELRIVHYIHSSSILSMMPLLAILCVHATHSVPLIPCIPCIPPIHSICSMHSVIQASIHSLIHTHTYCLTHFISLSLSFYVSIDRSRARSQMHSLIHSVRSCAASDHCGRRHAHRACSGRVPISVVGCRQPIRTAFVAATSCVVRYQRASRHSATAAAGDAGCPATCPCQPCEAAQALENGGLSAGRRVEG